MKNSDQLLRKVFRDKLHQDLEPHIQKKRWLKKALGNKRPFTLTSLFVPPYIVAGVFGVLLVFISVQNFQNPIGFQSAETLKTTLAYHNTMAPSMELRAELDEIITNASLDYADESEALNEEILGE